MPSVVTSSRRRTRKPPTAFAYILGGVAVAAAILIVFRFSGTKPPPAVETPKTPETVNPARPAASPAAGGGSSSPVQVEQPPSSAPEPSPATNGISLNPVVDEPATSKFAAARAKHSALPAGLNGGAAEQIIGMLVMMDDMTETAPIPMESEEALRRDLLIAVTNDIVIYDDDDPKVVEMKERIADTKNQLKEILDRGGSVTDAIREYQNWVRENREIRNKVISEYIRIKREQSPEAAEEYLKTANEELVREGITPITKGNGRKHRRPAPARTREGN